MPKDSVENDQYYTKSSIAELCVGKVDLAGFDHVVEPAAGRGDFYRLLPKESRIGVDIDPKHEDVVALDFFDFIAPHEGSTLTIGNPPFGKNASLAYAFFQHAATYSDCIAFIVPRTFRKPSMINRLNESFHLKAEWLLDENAFYVETGEGLEDYSVPCVFQVWAKGNEKRKPIKQYREHEDFEFVKISQSPTEEEKQKQCTDADFCVRRVGGAAGRVYKDYDEIYRDFKSHYYIKQNVEGVEEIMSSIKWDYLESPKYDTAGNPSISKHDLICFYIEQKGE